VKGESTVLAGDFGTFKTYVSDFIADAIGQGSEFMGLKCQKHPVLILDRENSHATVSLRRYLVGELRHAENVKILGRFTETTAPELDNPELLKVCSIIKPFIIIDSLQDFHPGRKENDADDMTEIMQMVNALISAGAVGVLILHHTNKQGSYRGTTAIPGGGGAGFTIEKVGYTGIKIKGLKARDSSNDEVELKFIFPLGKANEYGPDDRVTYEVVSSLKPESNAVEGRIFESKSKILDMVKQFPGKSGNDIIAMTGINKKVGLELITKLVESDQLARLNGGLSLKGMAAETPLEGDSVGEDSTAGKVVGIGNVGIKPWLKHLLSAGPLSLDAVQAAAEEEGFKWESVRCNRSRYHIESYTTKGVTYWRNEAQSDLFGGARG
jgi:AAA domain